MSYHTRRDARNSDRTKKRKPEEHVWEAGNSLSKRYRVFEYSVLQEHGALAMSSSNHQWENSGNKILATGTQGKEIITLPVAPLHPKPSCYHVAVIDTNAARFRPGTFGASTAGAKMRAP